VGEPVSAVSAAAVVAAPVPLPAIADGVSPGEVVEVEVVVPGGVVVGGFAPGVARPDDPGLLPVPATGVDPDVLELPGLGGVVPAGVGLGAGGLLEELDGLGLGAGFGVLLAAGGGLLGAPPEPNANPITVPGAGS